MKRFIVALANLVIVLSVAGVDYPMTLVDGRGDTITLDARPERVMSIAPSTTEIVVELQRLARLSQRNQSKNLQSVARLVAVSDHCDLPAHAGDIMRLPIYPAPSIEALMVLEPDLILAADITSLQVVAHLRRMGLTVIVLNSAGLDGVVEDIRLVGQALDLPVAAEMIITDFQAVRTRIRAALETADFPKPRVLMALSPTLDYCVGQGVYADSLIQEAGGHNLGAITGVAWPKLSTEGVLAMDPDAIFILSDSASEANQRQVIANYNKHPAWKEIKAVQTGAVYLLASDHFSVPGPRLKEALPILFAHLYPAQ